MLLQEQKTVCTKVDVIQSSGLLSDSTVLDETWVLARASNKPLYTFALLWTSYSLSFGDSDTGHNSLQGKLFNITLIQVYAPTSNAEEAVIEWFYEDLQDLLELTPQKMSFSL